ncbi:MAG: hypothetical protein ACI8UO_000016 [Verrucomicrobiales bacterium]
MPDPKLVQSQLNRPEFVLIGIGMVAVAKIALTFCLVVFGTAVFVGVTQFSPTEPGYFRGLLRFSRNVFFLGLPYACAPVLVFSTVSVLVLFRTGWIRNIGISVGFMSGFALLIGAGAMTLELFANEELTFKQKLLMTGFVTACTTISGATTAVLLRYLVTILDRRSANDDHEW